MRAALDGLAGDLATDLGEIELAGRLGDVGPKIERRARGSRRGLEAKQLEREPGISRLGRGLAGERGTVIL